MLTLITNQSIRMIVSNNIKYWNINIYIYIIGYVYLSTWSDYSLFTSYNCRNMQKEFVNTKGVIRIVNRRTDNTMAKRTRKKRTNNDLRNITQRTKYRVARTPLKSGDELGRSGRVSCSCSNSDTRSVTLDTNPVQLITWYVLTGPFVRLFVSYHFITMHNITWWTVISLLTSYHCVIMANITMQV